MPIQENDRGKPEACPRCGYPPPPAGICRLCEEPPRRLLPFPLSTFAGFLEYFRAALRLITEKEYMGKLWVPFLLNCLAFVGMAYGIWVGIHPLIEGLLGILPDPLLFTTGIVFSVLLTLVSAWFLFPVLLAVFLLPFLDPISRIAEQELLGFPPPSSSRSFLGDLWDSMETTVRIFFWQLMGLFLTLALSFTGVGLILGILVGAFLAGYSFLDYPMARRGMDGTKKNRYVFSHWGYALGLGLGFELGLLIPFFNLFLSTPAAAVASSRIYLKTQASQSSSQNTFFRKHESESERVS
ncbi:MAG TPA: hypothetical protein ENK02_15480 [Planctomycetes bacterium]|nr:hypothetical protein [Planctomycetota bacterium]